MKIAVMNGSTVRNVNPIIENELKKATAKMDVEIFNLGVFEDEMDKYSYVQVSICIGLLISSGCVDFVVTGCSSGNGMMIACNMLPDVICGYASSPIEASLFGRINGGNVLSIPLGLRYGWAGELNLYYILEKLFEAPFGSGYPIEDSSRKRLNTEQIKQIKKVSQKSIIEIINSLDKEMVKPAFLRKTFYDFFLEKCTDKEMRKFFIDYTS